MNTFEDIIERIDAAIVDLTWPGGLFNYEEFREIHSRASRYRDAALQALSGERLTEQQKLIVALSMQGLPLPELLDFAHRAIDGFERGHLSARVLRRCIFPTYDWNTTIVERYRSPEVDAVLRRLAGLEGLDEQFEQYVRDEVLTGNAKRTVDGLRDSGQIR
jgi:hypothetical protein